MSQAAESLSGAAASNEWLPLLRRLTAAIPTGFVWKNADAALEGIGDIDYCAPKNQWPGIKKEFVAWARETGLGPVVVCGHMPHAMILVAPDTSSDALYELDVRDRLTLRGSTLLLPRDLLPLAQMDNRGFRKLRPGAEGIVKLVLYGVRIGGRQRPYGMTKEGVAPLLEADPEGARSAARLFGVASGALIKGANGAAAGKWNRGAMFLVDARTIARVLISPTGIVRRVRYGRTKRTCPVMRAIIEHGRRVPGDRMEWLRHVARTHEVMEPGFGTGSPKGAVIGIGGPDGSGKSTLIDSVLKGALADVSCRHMRSPGIMYRRNPGGGAPVTEPHGDPPYGVALSSAKVVYLFFDYLLAWMFRIRPLLRSGGWLILERGWWDMAVDPLRYRMAPTTVRLTKVLGRLLPRLDLILVLQASGAEIHRRKQELHPAEIDRQVGAWREVLPTSQRRAFINASADIHEVTQRAGQEVELLRNARNGSGWTALPSSRRTRWALPRGPRRVARSALRIYQPVTTRGLIGWYAARAFAALGGFRLLPSAEGPHKIAGVLNGRIPSPGTVAVASTNHPDRCVALLLDASGRMRAVAKIALDRPAEAPLRIEAEALARLAPLLPDGLSAPRVLESGPTLLLEEPVDWRPRLRSWRLAPELAERLGQLFSAGPGRNVDRGTVHGDCAPWNVFRTDAGWTLVDWESATDEGLAFSDVFHYVVQAHALLGRPSDRKIIEGIEGKGWIGRAIDAYAAGAGLSVDRVPELFRRWLEETLDAQNLSTRDGRACRDARARLLDLLGT